MDKGRLYEVYVTPIGNGRVSPEKFTHKATASNENVTVAFGASPGEYVIALYESGKLVQVPEGNPQQIVVPESTAIIFTLGRKPYEIVPLEPIISAPSSVKKGATILADIYVSLPKDADESVEITQIATNWITVTGGATIDSCDTYIGVEIQPGQIELVGSCTINTDEVTGKSFTIIVNANSIFGEGVISSATYTNIGASKDIKVIPSGPSPK
jgi:hypothetical protein